MIDPPTSGSALLRPWRQSSAPPGPCAIYGGRAALGCGRKAAIGYESNPPSLSAFVLRGTGSVQVAP
jgi:hypothetical protein